MERPPGMGRRHPGKYFATILTAVVSVALGPQVAANAAAAPSPRTVWTPTVLGHTDADDGALTGTLAENLFVGDCVAFAGSNIQLAPVGAFYQLTWTQTSLTSHTNHADVWHATFEFTDAAGNVVRKFGPFDGAQMTQVNRQYVWQRFQLNVVISGALFQTITAVKWTNAC